MEYMLGAQYTKIVEKLPSSVPFVGPESQEIYNKFLEQELVLMRVSSALR